MEDYIFDVTMTACTGIIIEKKSEFLPIKRSCESMGWGNSHANKININYILRVKNSMLSSYALLEDKIFPRK